jgi:aryl-alcohol dehydrogenase-like predicted oxidoreductase
MRYVPLGATGLQVSPLCLGAMMFGAWGNPDHEASVASIHQALDAGINFVDTANVYSAGESEEIVGKALKGRRDDVVLATKFHAAMGPGPNDRGNHRKHIFRAIEDSLRRLQTDYVDLYQVHRPDPATDIGDTLGALSDLVHQGKVRWIGSSTFPAPAIVEAQWAAQARQRERFVCEQPPYSILVREVEKEVLPTAARYGMGVIVWSPLAGGWLSGKYRRDRPIEASGRAARMPARFDLSKPENQAKLEAVEALAGVAEQAGLPLSVLATAWTLVHPAVTAAIIGPRTAEQLGELLPAAEVTLAPDILDAIDAIVAPGATLNAADLGYENVSLHPEHRRSSCPPPRPPAW